MQPAKHKLPIELPKSVDSLGDVITDEEAEELRYSQLTQTAACQKCGTNDCYALLDYAHVPGWLRDNAFLHTGYRVNIGM